MKTSYRISTSLKKSMLDAMNIEGYGSRDKSKWISEAIRELIFTDHGLESVGVGEDIEVFDKHDVISLTPNTAELLEKESVRLRRMDPMISGPRASIIRAAIRFRCQKISEQEHIA